MPVGIFPQLLLGLEELWAPRIWSFFHPRFLGPRLPLGKAVWTLQPLPSLYRWAVEDRQGRDCPGSQSPSWLLQLTMVTVMLYSKQLLNFHGQPWEDQAGWSKLDLAPQLCWPWLGPAHMSAPHVSRHPTGPGERAQVFSSHVNGRGLRASEPSRVSLISVRSVVSVNVLRAKAQSQGFEGISKFHGKKWGCIMLPGRE